MLILAIETATPVASIALLEGERVVASRYFDVGNQHSQRVFVEADHLFSVTGNSWNAAEAVVTTIGPGSFTGLRIGLSAAKGICLALGIPLVGVSTLQALAGRLPYARFPVCAMLDARRGQVYSALYSTKTGFPDALAEPRAVAPEDLASELSGTEVLFVGSGAKVYKEKFRRLAGANFAPSHLNNPDAATVGCLGLIKLTNGEVIDLKTSEPEYIRLPALGPARPKQN